MNTLIEQNIPMVSWIDRHLQEEVDEVVTRNLTYDWEWLRKEIKELDSDMDYSLGSNDHRTLWCGFKWITNGY